MPVWLLADQFTWELDNGLIRLTPTGAGARYVRKTEYTNLESKTAVLASSDMAEKESNELYFKYLTGLQSGSAVVRADENSNALMGYDLAFSPGNFTAHFPAETEITWTENSYVRIINDQFDPAGSRLNSVSDITISYSPNCEDADCVGALPLINRTLQPDSDELIFTRDGGLMGEGFLGEIDPLTWGYSPETDTFAHRAQFFIFGSYHMPGFSLRGDQVILEEEQRAGSLLYTGVASTNFNYIERPDFVGTTNQNGYLDGFADYAGLNLVVGVLFNEGISAESTLAGTPSGLYDLKNNSKYYVRKSGVSGAHDARFETFDNNMSLYGYPTEFSNFGLSFLSSQQHESQISGSLAVPAPSNFTVEFQDMRMNCLGGLTSATLAPDIGEKTLEYWRGRFIPFALSFERNPDQLCDPSEGVLVLGVGTEIAHVSDTLYGHLGFRSNGGIVTRADGIEGVDSRLKLPNQIRLSGPAGKRYNYSPLIDAYYNNYESYPQTLAGWVNIAGKLDVPFFEDLKVHTHTSAVADDTTSPIYMMGGWARAGESDNLGWQSGNNNYFNTSFFDESHRGFPGSTSRNGYRNSATSQYHVRAQRTWLNFIEFDYLLNWSTATRSFRSFKPETDDLLIISAEHELKYLSPNDAELTVGVQYDGLPQINLANIAFNAVNDATGVASAIEDAAGAAVQGAIDSGLGRLDLMLADQMQPFFDPVFDGMLDPVIDDLYSALSSSYQLNPTASWQAQACDIVEGYIQGTGPLPQVVSIRGQLNGLIGTTPNGINTISQIDDYLADVQEAIDGILSLVEELPNGTRSVTRNLIEELVGQLAADYANLLVGGTLDSLLLQLDPTLDQITASLLDIRASIQRLRQQLTQQQGLGTELDAVLATPTAQIELNNLAAHVKVVITNFFNEINYEIDSPFDHYDPEDLKAIIRQDIEDQFFGMTATAQLQSVIRERLYDLDAALRESIDSAFQQLNGVIRDLISQSLAEVDDTISGALGDLNSVFGTGQVNGYAHINGDALRELRLDVLAQMQVPSELEFKGFLRIKELVSDGTVGCGFNGDRATEVTLGATDVPLSWISPGMSVTACTKFTFESGIPKGLAGKLQMSGSFDYEAFEITDLDAALALGLDEYYLSAATGMRLGEYEVFGGFYAGVSCSLDPIALWDPDVAALLGDPPFRGLYAYGEGHLPINELVGIPSTCLFNISAGMGLGAGVFIDGPTFVGKMSASASGELLCLVNVRGEVAGTGVLDASEGGNLTRGLAISGRGTLSGKVGVCPFCKTYSKSVGLQFRNGDWDIDL